MANGGTEEAPGIFADLSRSTLQRVIDAGGVSVNGRVAKASYKVRHGDQIQIRPPEPSHGGPIPENIPLCMTVLYPWIPMEELDDAEVERAAAYFAGRLFHVI